MAIVTKFELTSQENSSKNMNFQGEHVTVTVNQGKFIRGHYCKRTSVIGRFFLSHSILATKNMLLFSVWL